MVDRASNAAYLTVVEPAPLENVGWTLRALSARDYASTIAVVDRFAGCGFNVDANDYGGGSVTLAADDPVLVTPLPAGESGGLVDQEAVWQVLEDGAVRFEWFAEDVEEDQVTEDGTRLTVLAGRGTGMVLDWALVLPEGMPEPTTLSRELTGHPISVWRTLFLEAQAAGFAPFVSLMFDAETDSAGDAWGPDQVLTVNAGEKLGDLLRRWCEANDLAWRMLPGFQLQVFQAYGSHREGEVRFPVWRSQSSHRRKITRRDLANVWYASSGDTGIAVAQDSTSIERYGKRAAWASAGDASDASSRSAVANTNLALFKDPQVGRTVRIVPGPGRRPFEDFNVHDWVRVDVLDDDTSSGVVRVVGLAVKVDETGRVQHEGTFQTRFEARAVRLRRLLDRLGASTTSGAGAAGASVIPVSKALAALRLADLLDVDLSDPVDGSVLQVNGGTWEDVTPALSLLADVDVSEIPTTGDVALVFDRGSGAWVPGEVSTGGGESGTVGVEVVLNSDLGDGLVDAGPALQVLLDTVAAAGGGTVAVPAGVYRIGATLEIGSGTHLRLSSGAILLRGSSTMTATLINKNDGTTGGYGQASNIRVSGGTFDGNGGAFSADHTLVAFGHASRVTVDGVRFVNLAGDWHCLELNAVQGARVVGCEFAESLAGTTEMVQLDLAKSSAHFPWFGPYDDTPCRDVIIEGNTFRDSLGLVGVAAVGSHSATAGYPHENITVRGNMVRNVGTGVRPYNWTRFTVAHNMMAGVHSGVNSRLDTSDGIYSDLSGVSIVGNVVAATSTAEQGRGISLNGNPLVSGRTLSDVAIVGNTVTGPAQYGIACDYGVGVLVGGNTVAGAGSISGTYSRVAIWLYRAQRAIVQGNRISGTNPTGGPGSNVADVQVGDTGSTVAADVSVLGNVCAGTLRVVKAARVLVADNHAAVLLVESSTGVEAPGNFVAGTWVTPATGGGAVVLNDLTDVGTAGVADGDTLVWDASAGEWVPGAPPGGGASALGDLTDVDTAGAGLGQVLGFDGTSWGPVTPAAGGGTALAGVFWSTGTPDVAASISASSDRSQGQGLFCTVNATITRVFAKVGAIAGETYRFRLYEATVEATTATLGALVGVPVDVASPGSVTTVLDTGTVAWDLTAGTCYVLLVTRLGSTSCRLAYGDGSGSAVFGYVPFRGAYRSAALDPSGSITVAAGQPYAIGFQASTR